MSEVDLLIFYWPATNRLNDALKEMPVRFDECYTMPGVKMSTAVEDLRENTLHLLSENVQITRPAAVANNMDGVKQLIASGHLKTALNVTTNILSEIGQGVGFAGRPSTITFYCLQVWSARFQLLMALEMYSVLNDELVPFEELDAPDLFLQYYPIVYKENKKGSLVPFVLRLIHAEALRFTDHIWQAIRRIGILESNTLKVLDEMYKMGVDPHYTDIWNGRLTAVKKLRARTLYSNKEYYASIHLYNQLCESETDENQRMALKLMLVRMALVMGDEKSMEKFLKEVTSAGGGIDLLLHKSLKYVMYGNYAQAQKALQKILVSVKDNPKIWNNRAVCSLYVGQVKESLNVLNEYCGDPIVPMIINFSTISEVAVCNPRAENTEYLKRNIKRLTDTFNPSTLKLL